MLDRPYQPRTIGRDAVDTLVLEYKAHGIILRAATAAGLGHATARYVLMRLDLRRRQDRRPYRFVTTGQIARLRQLRAAGYSYTEISDMTGLSYYAVRKYAPVRKASKD